MTSAVLPNISKSKKNTSYIDLIPVVDVQKSDQTERSRDGYVIFLLDSYSKTELKELKEKFILDLERTRKVIQHVESLESELVQVDVGNSVKKDCVNIGQKRTMQVCSFKESEFVKDVRNSVEKDGVRTGQKGTIKVSSDKELELVQVKNVRNYVEEDGVRTGKKQTMQVSSGRKSELVEVKNVINSIVKDGEKDGLRIGQKRTMQVCSDKEIKRQRVEENSMEIRKVETSIMRKCGVILAKLMKHKHGWVFNEPVDVVGLGLDDYYQVVKRPMDLGTIKMKLGKGVYETPLHFAKDIRLTFNNAMLYNRKGDDVYTMATVLLDLFDKLFDPVYDIYEFERQHVIVEQKKFGMSLAELTQSQVVSSQRDTENPLHMHPQAALPKKICKETGKKSVSEQKRIMPEAKQNPKSGKEMSVWERDKLGLVLQDLAGEYLNEILQILAKRNSKMTTPGEDGEIELDVHALDSETMWDLHRFARVQLKADQNRTRKQDFTSQSTLNLENNKSPIVAANETATRKVEEDINIDNEMPINNYHPVVIKRDNTPSPSSNVRSSNSSSSSSGTDSSSDSDSSSGSDSEISDAV